MASELQDRLTALLALAARRRFLSKAVLSKGADREILRAYITPFEKDGNVFLQIEYRMRDGKALHKNLSPDDPALGTLLAPFMQVNLLGDGADAEYRRSGSGNEVLLGEKRFSDAAAQYGKKIELRAHNRPKSYLFDGSEPFLFELGVADKNGRVYDKKQAKFRQINRFIEHVAGIYPALPESGVLHVLDLCCGKSYLSFAVYHYLTVTMGRTVEMVGIDLKEDVIAFCAEIAKRLSYDGLHFHAGNIDDYPYIMPVHLVVSLHACDIATDIVLSKAIALGAKVILSTPCCQKELLQNLSTDAFAFVTKYPMLKKKLCDALTDALRAERLAANGYAVTAAELTDPEDTPKNILLRAVKTGSGSAEAQAAYAALCESLVGDKDVYLKR